MLPSTTLLRVIDSVLPPPSVGKLDRGLYLPLRHGSLRHPSLRNEPLTRGNVRL